MRTKYFPRKNLLNRQQSVKREGIQFGLFRKIMFGILVVQILFSPALFAQEVDLTFKNVQQASTEKNKNIGEKFLIDDDDVDSTNESTLAAAVGISLKEYKKSATPKLQTTCFKKPRKIQHVKMYQLIEKNQNKVKTFRDFVVISINKLVKKGNLALVKGSNTAVLCTIDLSTGICDEGFYIDDCKLYGIIKEKLKGDDMRVSESNEKLSANIANIAPGIEI